LTAAGLPWRVAAGVGFWRRPEVLDVVNLVHAAATGDPLSTVGVARAPWMGASDQEVHDQVTAGAPHPAARRFAELVRARHDGAIVDWLRAALDDTDAWRAWDASARANVAQLLDAIAIEGAKAVSLPALARRLLARVEEAPRESEASPSASTARIVVLTVHAAKGLEFPVVVLPELDRLPRARPDPLAVARLDGELVLAASVDDPGAAVQTRAIPALLHRIRAVLRDQDDAEYRRLLYVAATRARDHLVLVGPSDASERSWAGRLSNPPASTVRVPASTLTRTTTTPGPRTGWATPRRDELPHAGSIDVTASDLVGFTRCAARWFRTRRLGMLEPGEQPGGHGERSDVAGLRGRVLHGLIEDRALDDAALAARRFRALAAGLPADSIERGLAGLEMHRSNAASNPELTRALDAPGFDELALRTPFPGGVFVGRIDRLYLDRDLGGFVVLDHKTEHLGRGAIDDAASAHELQLRAYGWAADQVLAARGQPPVVAGRLFFTDRARFATIGPWMAADHAELPAHLTRIATTVDLGRALELAAHQAPPCATCGFRGRGCPGVR
jgi:ATP-dependent exoDNAse (exonuclease V) beta subunit